MRRHLVLLYGVVAYCVFFATLLYAIGFVGNLVVPKSIDLGGNGAPLLEALLVNAALLGVFAVQHTGMARRGFKRWLTRLVPESIERSTYVLATCVAFVLLFWLWRPMTGTVWSVENPAGRAVLTGVFWAGWVMVFLATCMISHFELFGLRQVWLRWRNRPYSDLGFRTVGFYKFIRHPIQAGFLIAFWATPDMTVGHLLFTVGCTGYILVALKFYEEPDLLQEFGETYRGYMAQTSMLIPRRRYR